MIPVDPGEEFGELRIFGADQPEYNPLPARILGIALGSYLVTKWHLDFGERAAILRANAATNLDGYLRLDLLFVSHPLSAMIGVEGLSKNRAFITHPRHDPRSTWGWVIPFNELERSAIEDGADVLIYVRYFPGEPIPPMRVWIESREESQALAAP